MKCVCVCGTVYKHQKLSESSVNEYFNNNNVQVLYSPRVQLYRLFFSQNFAGDNPYGFITIVISLCIIEIRPKQSLCQMVVEEEKTHFVR